MRGLRKASATLAGILTIVFLAESPAPLYLSNSGRIRHNTILDRYDTVYLYAQPGQPYVFNQGSHPHPAVLNQYLLNRAHNFSMDLYDEKTWRGRSGVYIFR